MINFESYFRLFKSSWGILIGIKGDIIDDEISFVEKNIYHIVDEIYLELNIPLQNKYVHENKTYLINGIKWVKNVFPDKKILLRINEVDLNFCNFQVEGLFFGVANWICKYYNMELPEYECRFNNEENKYYFINESLEKLLYPDQKR